MRENGEKLIAATTNSGAKEKLNTRVLHGRDLQKVAAFSISTKALAVAVGSALHGAGTGTANVSVYFAAGL